MLSNSIAHSLNLSESFNSFWIILKKFFSTPPVFLNECEIHLFGGSSCDSFCKNVVKSKTPTILMTYYKLKRKENFTGDSRS
jgi:hypothetical protein